MKKSGKGKSAKDKSGRVKSGVGGNSGGGARGLSRERLFVDRIQRIHEISEQAAREQVSRGLGSSVRINRLSPRPADDIEADLRAFDPDLPPIAWCRDAFWFNGDKPALAQSPLFQGGHVYIQNASSLVPALALEPRPGDWILDVCAAPGGKTAHIQALAGGGAHLIANDALKPRVKKLREVLSTFHVPVEAITEHPGQYVDKMFDQTFDRILLDAQCSGEGMVNLSQSAALRFWDLDRITKFSYLQAKMLTSAFKQLKPGGVMVYSTCTYAPEENEAPVSRLLKHNPDADIEPIDVALANARPGLKSWDGNAFDPRLSEARRVLPENGMEAFFVCRIRKKA